MIKPPYPIMIFRTLSLFLFVTLMASCDGRRDIRNYYFPARDLTSGLVYAYENTGSLPGAEREYWYYLGVDLDTALHLSVTRYDDGLSPAQQSREEIRNDGVYLRALSLLPTDSTGVATEVKTDIIYNRVFPFYLDEETTTPFGYRIKFSMPDAPDAVNYVSMDRRFVRDTTISVLNKTYDALLFSLAGEVSLRDPEDGDISPQFSGYEIYAKGLGLVEFKRELGSGASLGGRLVERVPMADFAEGARD